MWCVLFLVRGPRPKHQLFPFRETANDAAPSVAFLWIYLESFFCDDDRRETEAASIVNMVLLIDAASRDDSNGCHVLSCGWLA